MSRGAGQSDLLVVLLALNDQPPLLGADCDVDLMSDAAGSSQAQIVGDGPALKLLELIAASRSYFFPRLSFSAAIRRS